MLQVLRQRFVSVLHAMYPVSAAPYVRALSRSWEFAKKTTDVDGTTCFLLFLCAACTLVVNNLYNKVLFLNFGFFVSKTNTKTQ
jgi:hypothetical protein